MDGILPKFNFLKLQGRGGYNSTPRLDGGGLFWIIHFYNLKKSSYQDLSNEESKKYTRTWFLCCPNIGIFFDKFHILAPLSRAQKTNNSEFNEFSTKV